MNKVYNYLNSLNYYPEGVVVIDNIDYKLTKNPSIRYSQIPEIGGVFYLDFGVWVIRPSEDVYYKVELFFVH